MASITERLKSAIQNFMRSPEYAQKNSKMRARYFAEEYEPALSRIALLDLLERNFRAEERRQVQAAEGQGEREEEAQLQLLGPDFAALFVSPRERLPLKNGKKKQLVLMTAAEFDESADALWREAKKGAAEDTSKARLRAKYLHDLARAMRRQGDRKLIFLDFAKLRATGIEPGANASSGTA